MQDQAGLIVAHDPGDEEFLDAAFDTCLDRVQRGAPLDLEQLAKGREHLRQRLNDLARLAREVAVQHPDVVPDVPGYEILGELGRGAMGTVYLARQSGLDRLVALKVLPAGVAISRESRSRFRSEAQALAKLRHPHIVPVHEVIETERILAYSMDWIEGSTLAARIASWISTRAQPVDRRQLEASVCDWGIAIARALEEVHRHGLLHRDVKPSNILLRSDDTALLSDFGLVRDALGVHQTHQGSFLGTPAYASPEQLRGEHDKLEPCCDVYSLGASLYQALALELPHGSRSSAEILRRLEEGISKPLMRAAPGSSRDICTIVHTAMDPDPDRRYSSAAALADDLERFRDGHPIQARPSTAYYRFTKLVGRHPAAAVTLGVLFLVLSTFSTWTSIQASELREQRRGLLRYSDLGLHGRLVERAEGLWPPHPEHLAAMDAWLEQAKELASRRARHAADFEGLSFETRLVPEPSTFGAPLQTAALLVERLDHFFEPNSGLAEGMRLRREFASEIEERSLTGAEAAAAWSLAIASISDPEICPQYAGLVIEPQLGLLPLGRNPTSGLWEFAHLQSGTLPDERSRVGDWNSSAASGLVFVLLPATEFSMGAQATSPGAPGYDSLAHDNESPVQRVALEPFWLSKYEVTQAQWRRLMHSNPSLFKAKTRTQHGGFTELHPVEQVTWTDCAEFLRRTGLNFPTEAQWEFAARAATLGPWWSGGTGDDLQGRENLEDRSAAGSFPAPWPDIPVDPGLDDGYVWHAPIGSFAPNAFGLHDMLGNLQEWCLDRQAHYTQRYRPGDGARLTSGQPYRVVRGGAFLHGPSEARASVRRFDSPGASNTFVGLRPALNLTNSTLRR